MGAAASITTTVKDTTDDVLKASMKELYEQNPERFESIFASVKKELEQTKENLAETSSSSSSSPVASSSSPGTSSAQDSHESATEKALHMEIVRELNHLRKSPVAYASKLEQTLSQYDDRTRLRKRPGNDVLLQTAEGTKAVKECIRVMKSQRPLTPFSEIMPRGMCRAARDHVRDTGPIGITGHVGTDKSQFFDRLKRYGQIKGQCAENISYGCFTAEEIVMQLMVDDNVPSRGHRKNILKPDFRLVGIATGPHKTFGTMCVLTHAAGYGAKLVKSGVLESHGKTLSKELVALLGSFPVPNLVAKVEEMAKDAPTSGGVVIKATYTPTSVVVTAGGLVSQRVLKVKWG